MLVFLILLAIGLIYLIYHLIHSLISRAKLKAIFKSNNTITFGAKGSGKDLLTQAVINARKKPYFANISYGGDYTNCKVSDLELGANSYDNFINGNVVTINKDKYPFENKDFYFSDCGIILPSQHDSILYKTYKSFPISYALSRHLWHNNIHCNTQNLDRVWKSLREQADNYILCKGVTHFLGFLKVRFIIYDKYHSAQQKVSMLPARLWNSMAKVERDKWVATFGRVEERFILIRPKKIYYNTRAYHSVIFGEPAPAPKAKK